ncbi:MAG TPA: LacI family DNA-binding transcriptional regulator [Lacunisphaera sp.]|nr:LacI family DNA-binding transcriptional regulator [Lacunisphaera sp.]
MNPTHRPTIRSLALSLGLSRTTVSEALRGQARVNRATRERVAACAKAAGYRFNPLASSLLSEVRRTRLSTFKGVLAAVGLQEPARVPFPGSYWRDLLQGARERSAELGFKLEHFVVGQRGLTVARLDTILRSRGIRGVLIMPAWNRPDFSQLSWAHFSGVYADYLMDQPGLSSVCPDHPRSMGLAMARLQEMGYRRPGLVLLQQESTRLEHRWLASFLAYLHQHPGMISLPPLIQPEVTPESFKKWFRKIRPDVVVGHRMEMIGWMKACGARIPESHGFCCLNLALNAQTCAGLDQRPYHVGVRAVELVISQIHQNTYGIPELPSNTTVPSRWVDGPTLRVR